MSTTAKPATWYWVVAILALLWNLTGVVAYLMQVTMTPEAMQALPPEEQELIRNTPAWATGAFAVAVWFGFFGSVLLLVRKAWAVPILILSLLGIAVQMYHAFFVSSSIDVFGPGGMIMPIMVILIAFLLVWLARSAKNRSWIS
jgi:hypothetical protein